MTARVRVPASSSNLGSGFDCVGVAIDRWLTASVTVGKSGNGFTIQRRGKLSAVKVRADQDLFTRGFRAASATGGVTPTGVTIDASSDIPVGCGLGSSAAAIVAGALLADTAYDLRLSRREILEIATTIEGHPDNVGPAVYGGAVLSVHTPAGGLIASPLRVAPELELLIAVPPFPNDTKAARAALPHLVPHADATTGIGRAAALVQGLATGDGALLSAALDDVLHVPYRREHIYGYDAVVAAARDAGAHGATLSGAGSAILAIAPRERAPDVGTAMLCAWRSQGVNAELIRRPETVSGASVTAHARRTTYDAQV